MKNFMIISIIVLMIGLFSGCKSYSSKVTTIYQPDGKTVDRVITETTEDLPFVNKCISTRATVIGLEASFVDPESGSWSPNVKLFDGDVMGSTLPVTSGGDYVQETFGTCKETLTYEKSLWGAEMAVFKYERIAGGAGVNMIPAIQTKIELNKSLSSTTSKTNSEVK